MLKLRTAVISVAVLALIATTAVVAVAQGETSDWQAVRGEAITRIGSEYMGAERDQVADSIANDVTSRGTVWRFMLGSDSGVLYGVGPSAVQSEVQVQTKTTTKTRVVNVPSGHGPLFGNQRVATVKAIVGVVLAPISLPTATRPGWTSTYGASVLPSGFTDTGGMLGGNPDYAGSTTVKWTVTLTNETDSEETLTDSLTFTITVAANTTPTLPPIDDQKATAGSAFTITLPKASGGNEPYMYMVDLTALPGLAFDTGNRIISGVPTSRTPEDAPVSLTYTVTDAGDTVVTEMFMIEVAPPN